MTVRVVYMHREEGEVLDVNAAIEWLLRGGVVLKPRERKFLGVFLMTVNVKYGFLRQDAFMDDFRDMIAPYVRGELPLRPSVKAARERFQMNRLTHKLGKMALAGDGRVTIEFVSDPALVPHMSNTFSVFEKHIGISRNGATNLYTGGFAGCLGMLISPTSGRGGLLAHIAQQGTRQGHTKRAYLINSTEAVLKLASQYWVEFNMVLFIGDVGEGDIEFREMPQVIRNQCTNGQKIRHIQDLRTFRDRAGQFLFDSHNKVLYLLGASPSFESLMAAAEFTDEAPVIESGHLDIESSTFGLDWHRYG
jgi:hypothetical protein